MANKTKLPNTRTFDGKRYSLVGTGKSQISKKKSTATSYADFQRRTNKLKARTVKVRGGYANYTRK